MKIKKDKFIKNQYQFASSWKLSWYLLSLGTDWRRSFEPICRLSSRRHNIRRLWTNRRSLVGWFGNILVVSFSGFGSMVTLVGCKDSSSRCTRWKVIMSRTGAYFDSLDSKRIIIRRLKHNWYDIYQIWL